MNYSFIYTRLELNTINFKNNYNELGKQMKKLLLIPILFTISANANAIEDTRKSCEAGYAKSCKIMGDLTRAGLGVDQNLTKAKRYYDRACFDGNNDACKELKIMNEDKK
jgi:TPR repeat protein